MNPELVILIKWHINRYKITKVQDIYKLLYQGILGNCHYTEIAPNILEEMLKEEIKRVMGDFKEPLMENISPDKKFVRINLRPFKWYEYTPDKLLLVMKDSAAVSGEKNIFTDTWDKFRELITTEELCLDIEEYDDFTKEMKEKDYPVVHHSEDYARKNQPAYRVVCREIFLDRFSVNKAN